MPFFYGILGILIPHFEGRSQIGFGRGYTWLCDDARATETKTEKEREREKQQSNNEQTS